MDNIIPELHWSNLLIIPGLLIGYTVHELAHGFTAYFLGDYSQVEKGKLTLNPFRHINWLGSVAFILIGIGWPNPLEADPDNFKRRNLDLSIVAAAGPLASFSLCLLALLLTLSLAAALVYASGSTTDEVLTLLYFPAANALPESLDLQALTVAFTSQIALASFWLTFTSLLPFPRLDGYVIIASLAALFRERTDKSKPAKPVPQTTITNIRPPINRYERRNNVSDIHFKLGTEYHEDNKYDDAIARYRQAISADQNFGPAYVNLGLAYLGKGRRREAIYAFRGAVQYADDHRSQSEAWYQLHQLSEVSPVDEAAAQESMAEMGSSPWTDTKPSPNWLGLGVSSLVVLIGGALFYGYLYTNLVDLLQT
jgi:Zn-dependent protease